MGDKGLLHVSNKPVGMGRGQKMMLRAKRGEEIVADKLNRIVIATGLIKPEELTANK